MPVLVRVHGAADGSQTPHDGRYVKAWNSNVEFGTLALDSTDDEKQARHFEDAGQVFMERQTISKVQRFRPDGEFNRPLRSIMISIERITDEA